MASACQTSVITVSSRSTHVKSNSKIRLIAMLADSQIYKDYERAFGEATGLPLNLSPVEYWQLAHHGRRHENPFCAMIAQSNQARGACLRAQQQTCDPTTCGARTVKCFAGLCETSVPLRVGENVIGFLKTGEVMIKRPTERGFAQAARQLVDFGTKSDLRNLREAYFRTHTMSKKKYESMVGLLEIFAQHLSLVANQLSIQQGNSEPAAINRARQFIAEHQTEELSLRRVAQAANMSSYYFCKMFQKATGVNFTSYLSRVRVEKAKSLLLNPNARVSEVAFDVGFTSITNFNRTFKQLVGQSPSHYRDALPKAA
jgi:AraC-like DNA-binding protein/ligand-binding sensor protein